MGALFPTRTTEVRRSEAVGVHGVRLEVLDSHSASRAAEGSDRLPGVATYVSVQEFADIDQSPVPRQGLSNVAIRVQGSAEPPNSDNEAAERVESDDKVPTCKHQFHLAVLQHCLANGTGDAQGLLTRRVIEIGEAGGEFGRSEEDASSGKLDRFRLAIEFYEHREGADSLYRESFIDISGWSVLGKSAR